MLAISDHQPTSTYLDMIVYYYTLLIKFLNDEVDIAICMCVCVQLCEAPHPRSEETMPLFVKEHYRATKR